MFRITAKALRLAQGDVRCGICSAQFNALDSLRDAPTTQTLDGTLPESTMTVEELPGNELIDLSTATEAEAEAQAEAETETEETFEAEAEADFEAERDAEVPPEGSFEFRGTAEDAARLFVTENLAANRDDAYPGYWAEPASEDEASQDGDILRAIDEISRADLSGIEVREEPLFEEGDPASIAAALASLSTAGTGSDEPGELDDLRPPDDSYQVEEQDPTDEVPALVLEDGEAPPRILIPAALRRDLAASSPSAAEDLAAVAAHDQQPRSRGAIGLAVGALLVVALALQGVHFWRDTLARNPVAGPWILRAYAALDLPIDLPSDLAAFELRQWGATSDATQAGQLRLRASIVNRAAFAQPYPLLRLSLQDRFGNTIGVRDVAAGDYLPGGRDNVPRLLAPQQRADAEIVFVDPGREAVGFELDVCLEGPSGVRCASALPGSRQ